MTINERRLNQARSDYLKHGSSYDLVSLPILEEKLNNLEIAAEPFGAKGALMRPLESTGDSNDGNS